MHGRLRPGALHESGEAVCTWPCDRRDFVGTEFIVFRAQVSCGFHRVVPGYFLAAVAGLAAEDAGHGVLGDVLSFVDGLAFADARDEVGVFELVGRAFRSFEFPSAAGVGSDVGVAVASAFRAGDEFGDDILAMVDLASLAEDRDAVRVFEFDGEVVKDLAVALAEAGLAAAEALPVPVSRRVPRPEIHRRRSIRAFNFNSIWNP